MGHRVKGVDKPDDPRAEGDRRQTR
jgi:hypothetical protein